MRLSILALSLVISGLGFGSACAGERGRVAVSLYFAQNTAPLPDARLAPDVLGQQLGEVFGFRHYILLRSEEVELGKEWQQWVVPRNDFFLRVEPLHRLPGMPRIIYYEIYDAGFIVARGRFEPREETPLFINGPDFKEGRFIFVLQAR